MTSVDSDLRRELLRQHSIKVIRQGQTPEGAYLAAPSFPTYRYSWFRDGSFIAEAMDVNGLQDSAAAFHHWVVNVVDSELASVAATGGVLHTRYLPDGTHGSEEWPNFQLDGFGTWLWAYARHAARAGYAPDSGALAVVKGLAEHLAARWSRPNFDCWEEHQGDVHPSTLGALYAGFVAAAGLLGDRYYQGVADSVRSYLLEHGTHQGDGDPYFTKHIGSDTVDANLLWLALPYGVVDVTDPLFLATLTKVRSDLQDPDGGVHRYALDTYYGGGSWLLLTADLAQVHLALGQRAEAVRLLGWIEAQADPNGDMPEQVATHVNDVAYVPHWEKLWGASAKPLLWSHAAYLRLVAALAGT